MKRGQDLAQRFAWPEPKPRRRRKRSRRKRCDAWVKGFFTKGKSGTLRVRHPRCRAWAMPNGRCRMHGGASTGPRTAEGKARVVAAMVEGRRKMVEALHAEGKRAPGGRKPKTASNERERKLAAEKAERRKQAAETNRIRASACEAAQISPRARLRQITREVVRASERKSERLREIERAKHEGCLNALAKTNRAAAIAHGWIPPASTAAEATPHNETQASGRTADPPRASAAAGHRVVGRDGRWRWRYGQY